MDKGQKGTLRSDFLVHWTGRDIQRYYKALCGAERLEYIHRLCGTLHEGLWMTKNEEEIYVRGNKGKLRYEDAHMTCFTEIKLSDVYKHTEHYGCLGFGFSRRFVIQRFGAPVQYVAGTDDDIITEQFFLQAKKLKALQESGAMQVLRESQTLQEVCDINLQESDDIFAYLLKSLRNNIVFIKNMSDPNHQEFPYDFAFLDESEWRIVYSHQKAKEGKLIRTHMAEAWATIPFTQADLKVLILPDAETRRLALGNSYIKKWLFENPAEVPIIVTVGECLQF